MTPKQFSVAVKVLIQAGKPVIVHSPPGCGKSDIVAQVVGELGYAFDIWHPVVDEPTDYKGFPFRVNETEAKFLPYGQMKLALEAKSPTVILIDDLGQATRTVQAALMQVLLARRLGDKVISEHVRFVAATNRKEDMAGVAGLLEPVKSRFYTILELTPSVDDWVSWAIDHNMPPSLIAYIQLFPEMLHKFVPTTSMEQTPCPRTVAHFGELLNMGFPADVLPDVLCGAVGAGFTGMYIEFERTWGRRPSVDAILASPTVAPIPDVSDIGVLRALCVALAARCNAKTASAIIQYARRLSKEFGTYLVLDAKKYYKEVVNNKDFQKWASENVDAFV